MNNYWHKQTNKPLYPEIEWNKPERRNQAGKLLIIGGDLHNLGAPSQAYETAKKTGVGSIKLVLPDKTKRLVGSVMPDALFVPSTATGEFSHRATSELLDESVWADGLLMPGDNGRNSETTILFESIMHSYKDLVVLTRDAVDILIHQPDALLERPRTTLVLSFAQLQKLVKHYGQTSPLTFTMDLVKLTEYLHFLTQKTAASIVTLHQKQLIVACGGIISTTKIEFEDSLLWRTEFASAAVCYQMWNPHKPFEALCQATYLLK